MSVDAPRKLTLTADIDIEAAKGDGKRPTFTMLAYSGAPITVAGLGRVVVDLAGLELSDRIPIHRDHDPGRVVGFANEGKVTPAGLVVAGVITGDDADAKTIVSHASHGFVWQASIGAQVLSSRYVPEGSATQVNGQTIKGPLTVATKTQLKEVSFVSMGADDKTTVTVAATAHGANTADNSRTDLIEMNRVLSEVDPSGSLFQDALRAGWTLDTANAVALTVMRERRPTAGMVIAGRNGSRTGHDMNGDDQLTCQLMLMGGQVELAAKRFGEQVVDRTTRPDGWISFCQTALRSQGLEVPHGRDAVIRAAFSTASISRIVGATVNKIALSTFLDASSNWRQIARIVPASDFKAGSAIRLTSSAGFELIPEGGEIKHGSLADEGHSFQVKPYGKMFGLTREQIINDDLSLLSDLPVILGNEGARVVADRVFSVLVANAGSFYSVGHGNLIHDALDVDGLTAAIKALRTQTDTDGRVIGFTPGALVVPAALEADARVLLSSMALARDQSSDKQPTGNPLAGLNIGLVVEPRLDASSETDWYLMAPAAAGAVIVAFLNGVQGPTIESQEAPFDRLGWQWRAFIDFDAALAEHRATVKSDVTPYA